jgi:hypothetical protein
MDFAGLEIFDKSDWKKDLLIGVIIGVMFIVGNMITPAISIGFPSLSLSMSQVNRIGVVGVLAPIAEEGMFRGALLGLLMVFGLGFWFAAFISAGAFTAYHLTAYGASLASTGAFMGAFIFGLLAAFLVRWRKNLLPAIVLHMIFNLYLLSKMFVVVGIG